MEGGSPAADSGQSSDHPGAESSVDICVLGHGARDCSISSRALINGARDVHSWGVVAFLVHAGDRTDHIFRHAQRSVNSTLLGVSDWQWTVCDTRFHVGRARAPLLINSRGRLHNPRSQPGLAVTSKALLK